MSIAPKDVHETLDKAILVEGYPFVLDLDRSHGSWLFDGKGERAYLDLFTFYASRALAYNHPKLRDKLYLNKLLTAARLKPSNCDVYTTLYADFVDTFRQKAMGPGMKHLFFIDGGALAVENALKAAFDWKFQKNAEAGKETNDLRVVHFTRAFHGRSGYTLSLTNTTDPAKTKYFPKFDWPRIDGPNVTFPIDDLETVEAAEKAALDAIDAAYEDGGEHIAAILIEPIQCEGGDVHFRPEFFRALRKICDERDTILAFDEVQTGFGGTGTMWYYEQLDVRPDVVAFAKKAQTGGVMASERFDEVESVFAVKSRISSTFGGNLVDFTRCARILDIVTEDNLLDNTKTQGQAILQRIQGLADDHESVTNPRGAGTMCAFDVADGETRDKVITACRDEGLLLLACGDRSVRVRPALDVTTEEASHGLDLLETAVAKVLAG